MKIQLLGYLLIFCCVLASSTPAPVIIVPGLTVSALETRYHKQTVPHYLCKKEIKDWTRIWVDVTELLPELRDCFEDTMHVNYDINLNQYSNKPGVEIRPVDFGGLKGVYSLDPSLPGSSGKIYGFIIDDLEKHGWTAGQTIFGAPYDWRVSAPDLAGTNGMFAALKALCETAYAKSGRAAHLVGHSMGGPFINVFLTTYVDQAWKDKFIGSYISMGGPLGGAADAVIFPLSGEKWRIPLSPVYLRNLTRTVASMPWMMPLPSVWGPQVIVSSPTRNYTAADLPQLFLDAGLADTAAMVTRAQTFLEKYVATPPRVPVHILMANNYTTPLTFTFPGRPDPTVLPTITSTVRGDSTVPEFSLLTWKMWESQEQPIVQHIIGSDHAGCTSDPAVWQLIREIAA